MLYMLPYDTLPRVCQVHSSVCSCGSVIVPYLHVIYGSAWCRQYVYARRCLYARLGRPSELQWPPRYHQTTHTILLQGHCDGQRLFLRSLFLVATLRWHSNPAKWICKCSPARPLHPCPPDPVARFTASPGPSPFPAEDLRVGPILHSLAPPCRCAIADVVLLPAFPSGPEPAVAATACLVPFLLDPAASRGRHLPEYMKLHCLGLVVVFLYLLSCAACTHQPPSASALANLYVPAWSSIKS